VTSFWELNVRFLRVSRKRQDKYAPNFFQGLRENTKFITTCIEKQCTGL